MDLSGLVLRDGDRARAAGCVVAVSGVTWFSPTIAVPLAFSPPGSEPVRRPSRFAVEVVGVDLASLDRPRAMHDVIDGWATLTGVWTRDRLVVTHQQPTSPAAKRMPPLVRPPCAEPADGWPEGSVDENVDVPTEDLEPFAISSVALFRPSRHQVVVVLAAEDPPSVEAALRPTYGARLCVVPSRYSVRQIDDALRRLRAETYQWLVYTFGPATAPDGQPFVTADVTLIRPSFAAWARSVPDGLLSVDPWLAPMS